MDNPSICFSLLRFWLEFLISNWMYLMFSSFGIGSSDQIWRVGLNFNWKGIYSLSPSEIKGNINNCPLIDKYKLAKPFHQKNAENKYCFSALVVKAYMYVMEGTKSIESLQLIACLSLTICGLDWTRIPKEVY